MSDQAGTALVTGASAGLGSDLARELASRGWDLLLTARSEGRLAALADELRDAHGVTAYVVPADLSRAEGPDLVADAARELGLDVGFLANNAGFGQFGPYMELDAEEEADQIMVNVMALTRLTRKFLPGMIERGEGRVLNVASTAAFLPGPLMAVYYATKAYVLSYSLALGEELRDTGVTVTCLCPGPTRTEFQERAGMSRSRLFEVQPVMESEVVTRQGVDAALAGRSLQVTGTLNKLNAFSTRLLPRGLAAKIARRVQSER